MNRIHLFLTALLLCVGVKGGERGPLILHSPQDYQVYGISPNGKWACGVYVNMSNLCYGFRWNLTTGETLLLSGDDCQSEASAVSDDGVVAGMFDNSEATDNGAPAYTAGYWKDGRWHHLPNIAGAPVTTNDEVGYANAITATGSYIGGAYNDKESRLIPLIWKDGEIVHTFTPESGCEGMIYTVSADGQRAAGWSVTPNSEQARVATIWEVGKGATYIMDERLSNAWCSGRKFSPGGKYLLYWEGYYDLPADQPADPAASGMALRAIYNVETGEKTDMPTLTRDPFNFDVFDITDSGTVVGYESPEATQLDQAIIFKDGKTHWLYDYLQEKGVNLDADTCILREGTDTYFIRAVGISNDEKTYAVLYYDPEGALCSMIIKLDEDLTTRPPVQLQATRLAGTMATRLRWKQPLAGAEGVTGYNIYRNGVKVNEQPVTSTTYIDIMGVDKGQLVNSSTTYHVTAIYNKVESEASQTATLTILPAETQAPRDLFARQVGHSGALLRWEAPRTNLTVVDYYDPEATVTGFGGGNNSFEAAIRIPAEEAALYAGNLLHSVSFYPMTAQTAWSIRIYQETPGTADRKLICTQAVTQPLAYGRENTVRLSTPVPVPADADLLVAVEVTVPADHTGYNVLGEVSGSTIPGQTDLLRMTTEPDFYSLYHEGQKFGATQLTTWAIGAHLTAEGEDAEAADRISHYTVYAGAMQVGQTDSLSFPLPSLTDGEHTLGVQAVYADGRISATVATQLTVAANEEVFRPISEVSISHRADGVTDFTWPVPVDDDETFISHCTDDLQGGVLGPVANNYNYIAATLYTPQRLRGFAGYRVRAFRFYPLTTAVYTFMLEEDGQVIAELPVEEYTAGLWNTVSLPEPVILKAGSTYRLLLDCYDVTPQTAPLGLDARMPYVGESDLYSITEGATYVSVTQASAFGNWMMGMVAVSPTSSPLPVEGYSVRIDGKTVTDGLLTSPTFSHTFPADVDATHRLNVDVTYRPARTVQGRAVFFTVGPSRISPMHTALLRVDQSEGYVRIEGEGVTSVTAVSLSGQTLASARGNVLCITPLLAGVCLLQVETPQGVQTFKVRIER